MQGLIPQGMAYLAETDWLLLTAYRENGASSVLSVVDRESGQLVKTVSLYKNETTPYTGHAGGLTVSQSHVWVSSEKSAYGMAIEDLKNAADGGKLVFRETIRTETNASFTTYADGVLWVGEFARFDFKTDDSHHRRDRQGTESSAWVTGYRLDSNDTIAPSSRTGTGGAAAPDLILQIPNEIQGMAVTGDAILLSQSYGRTIESSLLTYTLPREEPPHAYTDRFGAPVPIWFLDEQNRKSTVILPPMSEGIAQSGTDLYILFESGAEAYRDGFYPVDRLYRMNLQELLALEPSVPGAPKGEPPLLITEVMAASPGTGQPYEYIELYNNSEQAIDLYGYKLYYYYDPVSPDLWNTKVTKWSIMTAADVDADSTEATDMLLKPHQTKVIWLKKPDHYRLTLDDFNAAYGTNLKKKDIAYSKLVAGQGLSDTTQRFLAVVAPRGNQVTDRISYVTYNGSSQAPVASCGGSTPCDFAVGESIVYFYPKDGLNGPGQEMERMVPESLHQTPTPGRLLPTQIRSIARGR
ncbi:lamin tail domain-containing protein [Paenibacillus sp. J31TS4]|uniref:lamin tail domain-containing protein n=1 Tax=Paenibacillus sp. J31TS4 TaxID=2807195 RepID=UPI0020C02F0B|nr:lamin tail domain-containing protein [Paenibacillus sp. J31TS4]